MTTQVDGIRLSGTHVVDMMSTPVLTVETDETLWDAWQLMFVSGLRHLVVVDEHGATVGVISDRMIITSLPTDPAELGGRRIGDAITASPHLRVDPTACPSTAAETMVAYGVEAVPVVDPHQRLVGLVTETDLVRWLVQ